MKFTKSYYASMIESHHLYEPNMPGVHSKRYYRYSPAWEINYLMRHYTKDELKDWYESGYGADERELSASEIG